MTENQLTNYVDKTENYLQTEKCKSIIEDMRKRQLDELTILFFIIQKITNLLIFEKVRAVARKIVEDKNYGI
jgi:predicted nucleic acid-binding Zn ribbon protein